MNLEKLLQKVYASEINIKIETFWDAGYTVSVGGSEMDGWKRTESVEGIDELKEFIIDSILELYPNSRFAKEWA